MSTSEPVVHVLVPSFNQCDALACCLESVLASEGVEPRILVVDDASSDGSAELVRERFPTCRLLVNASNLGFGGGCNTGFTVLLEERAERIFLLNQDALVGPQTLARLTTFLDAHPRAGIVGPKVYTFDRTRDGRERLLYAGSWRRWLPLRQRIPGIGKVEEMMKAGRKGLGNSYLLEAFSRLGLDR